MSLWAAPFATAYGSQDGELDQRLNARPKGLTRLKEGKS